MITLVSSCWTFTNVVFLHLGQNSGKFSSTVSLRIFVLVLFLQTGHSSHFSVSIPSSPCGITQYHFCGCHTKHLFRLLYRQLVPLAVYRQQWFLQHILPQNLSRRLRGFLPSQPSGRLIATILLFHFNSSRIFVFTFLSRSNQSMLNLISSMPYCTVNCLYSDMSSALSTTPSK